MLSQISKLKRVFSCALSGGVPLRSFYVALVVGTILNLINQGDVLLARASLNWFKIILTYFVPYAACTYGAVYAQINLGMRANAAVPKDPTCH
jgi:hypothetical protein